MTDQRHPSPLEDTHRSLAARNSDLPSLARKQPALSVDDFAAELVTLRIDISELKLRITMLEKPR